MCGSCVWLVKTLKCEVADPDTQDDFIRVLLKDLCPQLPAQAQESCTQLVPALVPTAIMYMQSLSAKELCADATLCGPAPAPERRPFALQQQEFNYCPMCKVVVIGLKQELKNPGNEKALIERAHEVCCPFPSPCNHARLEIAVCALVSCTPMFGRPVALQLLHLTGDTRTRRRSTLLSQAHNAHRPARTSPRTGRRPVQPMWTSLVRIWGVLQCSAKPIFLRLDLHALSAVLC